LETSETKHEISHDTLNEASTLQVDAYREGLLGNSVSKEEKTAKICKKLGGTSL
jgi:hypothetical protein